MMLLSVCSQLSLFILNFALLSTSIMLDRRQELLDKTFKFDHVQGVYTHQPIRTDANRQFLDYVSLNSFAIADEASKASETKLYFLERNVRDGLDLSKATKDKHHEIFIDLGQSHDSPLSGFHLHLKRHYNLVSKNFVSEERNNRGEIVERHSLVKDCHYRGVIRNHRGYSKVSVSLCRGLQGIILKDEEQFVVEPKWNHTAFVNDKATKDSIKNTSLGNDGSHPHIIFKRSILHPFQIQRNEDKLGYCGFSDKVVGNLPWWRVDPRKQEEDNKKRAIEFDKDKLETNVIFENYLKHKLLFQHRTYRKQKQSLHTRKSKDLIDINNKKHSYKRRQKRSISIERNVETLVVADKTLVGYHGRDQLESYILSIMNNVASLYHDASIGNAINIVVTRIILLTGSQPDLLISHHGSDTLDSFCHWQERIKENHSSIEGDFPHHDNAILITGFDICTDKDEPCATLGMAPVAGMCSFRRSCSINQDTGLSSAFTIAHEMGHNFGMHHDGLGNECGTSNGIPSQIMAARITKNTSPYSWSHCSKRYITKFLESDSGDCLLNSPPKRGFNAPEQLPGQIYDADEQCRFEFGAQSRQCRYGEICRELWCLGENKQCATHSVPAAEGTNCSSGSILKGWCYRGQCVPFGYRPQVVNGDWGSWTSWSECSRTCGRGASSSSRSCNNPPPGHGGKYCLGERMRYRICNSKPCPGVAINFRSEQCAQYDVEPYDGLYYNWIPLNHRADGVNPCALNCIARGHRFYTERASAVIDGTPCFAGSNDICINGKCHHVGCDGVLHSEAVEDKCRVCGGDGSTCQTESGIYNLPVVQNDYNVVVTIPRGSVNIFVQEIEQSDSNYIALKSASDIGYINNGLTIDYPREFGIAGTTFIYKRPLTEPESLQALGPTSEDLVLMIYAQDENVNIKYEFNIPIEQQGSGGSESAFLWEHGDWTRCSASCAGGTQRRPILCKRVDDDTEVQSSYCDPLFKPVLLEQMCNAEPCPALWKTGSWSECSRTCGGGYRTRSVTCLRRLTNEEEEVVDSRYCSENKPTMSSDCESSICPPQWVPEQWSQCLPSCGDGQKTRKVRCMSSDHRTIYSNDSICGLLTKPNTIIRCRNKPCPPPRWHAYGWSQCSTKCGLGQRRRRVVCIDPRTESPSDLCSPSFRPKTVQSCRMPCTNQSNSEKCVDDPKARYCHLVLKFHFCDRTYFQKTCCKTCSRSR